MTKPAAFPHQFLDIFTDVRCFQVGCLKPSADSATNPTFVPIFPFMYESIGYGEMLRGRVRLSLLKQSRERTNVQRELE